MDLPVPSVLWRHADWTMSVTAAADGTDLSVDVRGHAEPAKLVPLPFYKRPIVV